MARQVVPTVGSTLAVLCLLVGGCQAGASVGADALGPPGAMIDAAPDSLPPDDQTVQAFQATQISFTPTADHRHARAAVLFPGRYPWERVVLNLSLSCPQAHCDVWDRWGYLGVANGDEATASVTEIFRFITPYGVGAAWAMDVTMLAPLLAGQQTLELFVDTWVGPGHPQGNGWLVDATFAFSGRATDDVVAKEILPLWAVQSVGVGDPAKASDLGPVDVLIPAGAERVELRSIITGHGQGNLGNCAEFCSKSHTYGVGGMAFSRQVWRADCATTGVRPQGGAYPYAPRAGWCPGAAVVPSVVDITSAAPAGAMAAFTYSPERYENTCRPDAPVCGGCPALGACPYNDGSHTAPFYEQSALLVIYGRI